MSSSHQTVRYSSRNLDLSAQCDEIEKSTKSLQATCATTLRAGVEPVLQLPETIQLFISQKREKEIPKLERLVKSIAGDYDAYIAEKKVIDAKFAALCNERPSKKSDLARYSNKINFVGHEYIDLIDRARNTLLQTIDDYMDLIQPPVEVEAVS